MQGLMSSYPLTLTHVFDRAERIFPEKEVATVQAGGIDRITYGEWAERTRRLAGVLDALEISADGRVGTFAWNTAPPPRALLRRALQRPRPAHAEHPSVPGRHHLHRQPRRGRGDLRRPVAAEGAVAAGRRPRDRQARRGDGRRRRRRDPRRPADPRLRDAARRSRPGREVLDRRREPGRGHVLHERHDRPSRRASSTRTARPSCTRWARWSSTPPRSPSATP